MSDRPDPSAVLENLRGLPDDQDIIEPLINFRRRTVIRYLDRLPEDVTVGITELARVTAALEQDTTIREVSNHEYRVAYQALQGRDLRRLSLLEILDMKDRQTISRGKRFDHFATVLRAIDETLN